MKKIFLSALVILLSTGAFAQARTITTEYQKNMQPAVETEVPFPEKTVMKSIIDKMEKLGYKGKETKGYTVFKGVRLQELGPDSYDLYFKTDKKAKQKDATIVTMLVSSGYEKFLGEADNAELIENAKTFLNKQTATSEAYDLEMQIKDQEEVTKKAEKKLANLVEDGEDLQKKKAKLEKDIEENIKKQADQKAEIEKQQQIFETLKGKRKQ